MNHFKHWSAASKRIVQAQTENFLEKLDAEWRAGRPLSQVIQEVRALIQARGSHPGDRTSEQLYQVLRGLQRKQRREQAQAPQSALDREAGPSCDNGFTASEVPKGSVRCASLQEVPSDFKSLGGGFYRKGHSIWELRTAEDEKGGYVLTRKREEKLHHLLTEKEASYKPIKLVPLKSEKTAQQLVREVIREYLVPENASQDDVDESTEEHFSDADSGDQDEPSTQHLFDLDPASLGALSDEDLSQDQDDSSFDLSDSDDQDDSHFDDQGGDLSAEDFGGHNTDAGEFRFGDSSSNDSGFIPDSEDSPSDSDYNFLDEAGNAPDCACDCPCHHQTGLLVMAALKSARFAEPFDWTSLWGRFVAPTEAFKSALGSSFESGSVWEVTGGKGAPKAIQPVSQDDLEDEDKGLNVESRPSDLVSHDSIVTLENAKTKAHAEITPKELQQNFVLATRPRPSSREHPVDQIYDMPGKSVWDDAWNHADTRPGETFAGQPPDPNDPSDPRNPNYRQPKPR